MVKRYTEVDRQVNSLSTHSEECNLESTVVSAARSVSYLWLQTIISAVARIVAFIFFARLISVAQMGVFTILSLAYSGAATVECVTQIYVLNLLRALTY